MDYGDVFHTVETMGRRGWRAERIGEADGYPLFALERRPQATQAAAQAPSLLISAGIHGEEPASVVGLLRWLTDDAERWVEQIHFTIVPCLNPWGYERGLRHAAHGRDLNREFDAPTHPAVHAFRRLVAGKRFDLFLDLHEDCDFTAAYLYEVQQARPPAGRPTLGRRILERMKPDVALSHGELVERFTTDQGMITAEFSPEEAKRLSGAPIALYVYAHHAPHVVTLETPGRQPLHLRARLQGRAIEETCRYLTDPA